MIEMVTFLVLDIVPASKNALLDNLAFTFPNLTFKLGGKNSLLLTSQMASQI